MFAVVEVQILLTRDSQLKYVVMIKSKIKHKTSLVQDVNESKTEEEEEEEEEVYLQFSVSQYRLM